MSIACHFGFPVNTAKDYKETVNLPQTNFSMRANAVVREPEIQAVWEQEGIYAHQAEHNPGEVFVLHDGPPYANGNLHAGHALNRILKDAINRYQVLRGRKVRYVPGWDCHGLPIELKVLQQMGKEERQNLTPIQLRKKAREFALAAVSGQMADCKRWGVWGDFDHPYKTLDPEYEAAQLGVFGQMVLNGYIYRGLKPVHWSPSSQTALAEAELEYPEGHISRSIYVKFPVLTLPNASLGLPRAHLNLAIWTTTPWTIPGNLAVCLNGELVYAVVADEDDFLILAKDRVAHLEEVLGRTLLITQEVLGKDLEGVIAQHPIYERPSPVVLGDYVTTESGTGAVHTAPGHGVEDFEIGRKYGLGVLSPVDNLGRFTDEAPGFEGLKVLDEGNQAVIESLKQRGFLLKEEAYNHKYPYDWRTKKPTIFRATTQWFASVAGFREIALQSIEAVTWVPAVGKNRIIPMVAERSDWCISRQRAWGLPIPVFYDSETSEPLLTEETISHVQEIFRRYGSDAWWELSVEELLPETYRNNGRTYHKETDIMDVWFDSGCSWAAVLETRPELHYPADLYLEGSDQHRGWFQSSLLTSAATRGQAPYKTVLTHGFVLDEQGRKMSKSLGNVVDPKIVIEGGKDPKKDPPYGADILRLWVSSVDYSTDVPLGKNILSQTSDVYRKIRNTARYLLSNLYDFNPEEHSVAYQDLPEIDHYILHRLYQVEQEITQAFDSYQFFKFFQTIQNFCVVDLSNFYLDVAKDRLYISAANSVRRRSCQTVLAILLESIAKMIGPILCHLAEDIWQNIPYSTSSKSLFQAGWVEMHSEWYQPKLEESWDKFLSVRNLVNKALETAREQKVIGSSLEAKILVSVTDEDLRTELERIQDELRYLFITSQVAVHPQRASLDTENDMSRNEYSYIHYSSDHSSSGLDITVGFKKAEGEKCPRCWNYSVKVGSFASHPDLCERCVAALE
jgi:isoleucyl-tRNA synthetase